MRIPVIGVAGNPNVGKTTLFNSLTGLRRHVGNYPGVTIEKKTGRMDTPTGPVEVLDLPGTYSLAARSPDEIIVTDALLGRQPDLPDIRCVIAIVDASNIERNLYLVSQLFDFDFPVILALNMVDVAESRDMKVDAEALADKLGAPVIPLQAHKGIGVDEIKAAVAELLEGRLQGMESGGRRAAVEFPETFEQEIHRIQAEVKRRRGEYSRCPRPEAIRLFVDAGGYAEKREGKKLGREFVDFLEECRERAGKKPGAAVEAETRYAWIKEILDGSLSRPETRVETTSDRIDSVLTHRVWGSLIFFALMFIVFEGIFTGAQPAMELIDKLFGALGSWVGPKISGEIIRSLVVDGVIAGVGGVVIFLPQILLLFFFIVILEDCGYMARAAMLMDKLLSWCGLSGKSFVPMLSSLACAVPGIMAARTIENRRDRLATILVAPLMSCSARMPVYIIFIAIAIPPKWQALTLWSIYSLGFFVAVPVARILKVTALRGETPPFLMEMPSYKMPQPKTVILRLWERGGEFLKRAGTIIFAVTIIVWALLYFPRDRRLEEHFNNLRVRAETAAERLGKKMQSELGDGTRVEYGKLSQGEGEEVPTAMSPGVQTLQSAWADFSTSLVELLAEADRDTGVSLQPPSFELSDTLVKSAARGTLNPNALKASMNSVRATVQLELNNRLASAHIRYSWLGRFGRSIEPVFRPLGWDWKLGVATLASFPARELIVATLGTIYSLGADQDEASESLRQRMRQDTWPGTDRKIIGVPTALSVLVFYALCLQCIATVVTIRREAGSWKWAAFAFIYATTLAYFGAAVIYHIASAF